MIFKTYFLFFNGAWIVGYPVSHVNEDIYLFLWLKIYKVECMCIISVFKVSITDSPQILRNGS